MKGTCCKALLLLPDSTVGSLHIQELPNMLCRQSALHVAAAEGNLPAARLLVHEGKADVGLRDRWGYSPLDFAHKVMTANLNTPQQLVECMSVCCHCAGQLSHVP